MPDWPIYLINLDTDVARLDQTGAELNDAGIAWRRIPAVNGRALSAAELAQHYDAEAAANHARYPLVPPEIGCYLSHRAAWQALIDSNAEGAVVLEDDLRVVGDLSAVINALKADKGDWDIAKLFSFRPIRFLGSPRALTGSARIGTPHRVPSTTLGYAITLAGARKALAASDRFFRPIDEDHKFFWESGLRIDAVDPSPLAVGTQDTAAGTVSEVRLRANAAEPRTTLQQTWINMRYQLRYRIGLWRARRGW
ncbi:MAG: glycosyltransferase family 25 protein [Roseicyclus sp.]